MGIGRVHGTVTHQRREARGAEGGERGQVGMLQGISWKHRVPAAKPEDDRTCSLVLLLVAQVR